MVYDPLTADRFREAVSHLKTITEKNMMGGVCFLLSGHMIGGADKSKDGGIPRFMFRLGKENHDRGLALDGAIPMEQGGRKMSGFFFVEEDGCDDELLAAWIAIAVEHASALPPK